MVENLNEFIKELSEVYDPDSMNTYVTLYLKRDTDRKFVDRRVNACNSVLKGAEQKNFNDTINDIKNILRKNIGDNVAIFASHKHNFQRYVSLSIPVENLLIVDSSPYLRPLARLLDEWESFTLVLINSNYAKIFSVSLGRVDDTKKLSKDIMNKHKKGGWSQARFNRLRKGAIHAFFSEVVEELEKRSDKQIIIAGPGTSKNQFIDMLPKNLRNKIIDVIDIDIDDEDKLIKNSLRLISEKEKRTSYEIVQHLKEEILKDGLAVYGVKDTIDAAKNGQIELLIIQKNYKLPGWICENCQIVETGFKKHCPYCGKKTSQVYVLEEIIEFAERTDAEVEFTDDEEIAELGHVAGLLRFK